MQHCQAIGAGDPELASLTGLCEFALTFRRNLPDFICEQTTSNTGANSTTVMKAQVTFEKGHERYSNVTLDGKPVASTLLPTDGEMRFITAGELGSNLVDLFREPIAAEFKFHKQAKLRGRRADVFSFHIPADKNTFWALRERDGITVHPEYQGQLWLDHEGGRLLRLELEPMHMPSGFTFASARVVTDYNQVPIAEAGVFVLPSKSESTACLRYRGNPSLFCTRNVLTFQNCRKFGASTRIMPDASVR
jgi:hypothetical protein